MINNHVKINSTTISLSTYITSQFTPERSAITKTTKPKRIPRASPSYFKMISFLKAETLIRHSAFFDPIASAVQQITTLIFIAVLKLFLTTARREQTSPPSVTGLTGLISLSFSLIQRKQRTRMVCLTCLPGGKQPIGHWFSSCSRYRIHPRTKVRFRVMQYNMGFICL